LKGTVCQPPTKYPIKAKVKSKIATAIKIVEYSDANETLQNSFSISVFLVIYFAVPKMNCGLFRRSII
jgi:hypothetical protein